MGMHVDIGSCRRCGTETLTITDTSVGRHTEMCRDEDCRYLFVLEDEVCLHSGVLGKEEWDGEESSKDVF